MFSTFAAKAKTSAIGLSIMMLTEACTVILSGSRFHSLSKKASFHSPLEDVHDQELVAPLPFCLREAHSKELPKRSPESDVRGPAIKLAIGTPTIAADEKAGEA